MIPFRSPSVIIRVFKYISDWLEAITAPQKPALSAGKLLINVFLAMPKVPRYRDAPSRR